MSRRRRLVFALLGCVLLLLALPLLMSLRTAPPAPLDLNLEIQLPDGTRAPLSVVVERAAKPPAEPPPQDVSPQADSAVIDPFPDEEADGKLDYQDFLEMFGEEGNPNDLYRLAQWAEMNGRTQEAVALLRSIPSDDPHYARARRSLGWDFYARKFDDPTQGIYFVNQSLAADPFEGNAWQDAYRIYWRSLID